MKEAIKDQRVNIIRAFNKDPKKGIEQIKNIGKIYQQQDLSTEIAEFFKNEKSSLDLAAVGDYLGSPHQENKLVLSHFVQQMDFKNKPFTGALREFLQAFKLPGEAQAIDRVMEKFAEQYIKDNPNQKEIDGKDAAYVLAFQVIMLNTDLHNPAIKKHMTIGQLKSNLSGINHDKDFDPTFLESIYSDIKAKPFELNFIQTPPGIEIKSTALNHDNTFQRMLSQIDNPSKPKTPDFLPKDLQQDANLKIEYKEAQSQKLKHAKAIPFLKLLMGYEGSIKITNNQGSVNVSIYKPNIISSILFGKKPRVTIEPGDKNESSLDLCAKVAANFKTQPTSFKSTYDYEKTDIQQAFNKAQARLQSSEPTFLARTSGGDLSKQPNAAMHK